MEYLGVVLQQNQQHTIIKPDPRPYQPLNNQPQAQVPDGGAGWTFVLAAVVTLALAGFKRYRDRHAAESPSHV